MAESDYDKYKVGSGTWQGGDDGDIITHADYSSPLTNAGTYGRLYKFTSTATGGVVFAHTGSAFIGVANTNSISMRAWVRTDAVNDGAVGIVAKADSGSANFNDTGAGPKGYSLWLGTANDGSGGPDDISFTAYNGSTSVKNYALHTISSGSWTGIRMDILPTIGTKDVVNIYTTTDDPLSPTWTLRASVEILDGGSGWLPWSSTRRLGHFAMPRISGTGGLRKIDAIDVRISTNP